jgi:hypothetical protein
MTNGRTHVSMSEVNQRFEPRRWLNNAHWYLQGYWPTQEAPVRNDFVITTGLDAGWIKDRFGTPRSVMPCFGSELWIYDRPSDVEFRNYVRSFAARTTRNHKGWWEIDLAGRRKHPKGAVGSVQTVSASDLTIAVPFMQASVIELVSSTRKPLELSYRRSGALVARQSAAFPKGTRQLLAIPRAIGATGFDSVVVTTPSGSTPELDNLALIDDAFSETARP